MGVASWWRPGARRVHRTRLRSAPADELFRLATTTRARTLDCARLSPNRPRASATRCSSAARRSIWPPAGLADQQRRVVAAVRAEAQAAAVARLRRAPLGPALSEAADALGGHPQAELARVRPPLGGAAVGAVARDASGLRGRGDAPPWFGVVCTRGRALLAALAPSTAAATTTSVPRVPHLRQALRSLCNTLTAGCPFLLAHLLPMEPVLLP